jgi:hypothetical protein
VQSAGIQVTEVLTRSGGVADARTLVAFTRREAHRLSGVVTGASAAAAHGWELKSPPVLPTVTVPAKRKVVDCARTLPFDEALAVADSALRHGAVTSPEVQRLAEQVRTTGRAQARGVCGWRRAAGGVR